MSNLPDGDYVMLDDPNEGFELEQQPWWIVLLPIALLILFIVGVVALVSVVL